MSFEELVTLVGEEHRARVKETLAAAWAAGYRTGAYTDGVSGQNPYIAHIPPTEQATKPFKFDWSRKAGRGR